MTAVTSIQNLSPEELSAAGTHSPLFSQADVVEAVVVPGLDPAKVAPVFSTPS